jgi:hypothetical protein
MCERLSRAGFDDGASVRPYKLGQSRMSPAIRVASPIKVKQRGRIHAMAMADVPPCP